MERDAWNQGPAPGAAWGIVGPLIGGGFALYYGGSAVYDAPVAWTWLLDGRSPSEAVGLPKWLVFASGSLAFLWLVSKHPIIESQTTWIVTDKKLVRSVRHLPWWSAEWSLRDVEIRSVRAKKDGARVKLRAPGRWGKESFSIRTRDSPTALVDALRAGGARDAS